MYTMKGTEEVSRWREVLNKYYMSTRNLKCLEVFMMVFIVRTFVISSRVTSVLDQTIILRTYDSNCVCLRHLIDGLRWVLGMKCKLWTGVRTVRCSHTQLLLPLNRKCLLRLCIH